MALAALFSPLYHRRFVISCRIWRPPGGGVGKGRMLTHTTYFIWFEFGVQLRSRSAPPYVHTPSLAHPLATHARIPQNATSPLSFSEPSTESPSGREAAHLQTECRRERKSGIVGKATKTGSNRYNTGTQHSSVHHSVHNVHRAAGGSGATTGSCASIPGWWETGSAARE